VAIFLSMIVLLAWQYFFGLSQMQRTPQITQPAPAPGGGQAAPAGPGQAATAPQPLTRDAALKQSTRIDIVTPTIKGSIALKGGRIDDVSLAQYHETVDPRSPPIDLLSPSGSPLPFYAEFGWVSAAGASPKPPALPNADTVWAQEGSGTLMPEHPVVLTYDNGAGLKFRRTISLDDRYLFEVKDEVVNGGARPVTLYPYALISRHGTPKTLGHYIVHEGLIGELGDQGLQEFTYKKLNEERRKSYADVANAWLGITDKYWAATLVPDSAATLATAEFTTGDDAGTPIYQADYLLPQQVIAPGASASTSAHLFAGAKEVHVLDDYNERYHLNHLDLLIDWGWLWFFTKPMFFAIDYLYRLVGNFGVAILLFTTIVKLIFVPFANQSYRSMIKMGRLQPQIAALREQFPAHTQQKIMELYKRENVTAPSGCLPIVIQVLVLFALYKVLSTTIEMRHAPFFGWIHDLSAPDPTNIFTLFGLITWDPSTVPIFGSFMHLGALPILLGLSFCQLQRKIHPTLLTPFRRALYSLLPLLIIYGAEYMSAGQLLYITWLTFLSVFHQLLLTGRWQTVVDEINEYSAEVLPNGVIQPIVFLTMLAPSLQNFFTVMIFWRPKKIPKDKTIGRDVGNRSRE
jgi:YidC/Oxa1 family membrane protein insertase